LLKLQINIDKIILSFEPIKNSTYIKKVFLHKSSSPITIYETKIQFNEKDYLNIMFDQLPSATADNSESYYHSILEDSPIAKMIIDENGKVEKTNSALNKMFSSLELKDGWNLLDIIHDDYQPQVKKLLKNVVNGSIHAADNQKPLEIKIKCEKGISVQIYLNILISGNNAPRKLACHVVDTTEQKNLEMHFVHSQKMQAVGQLAGGIAHDFNNLLTAMIGFCDLLLMRHPAGDQSFADIMQIKQNSNRAANLVRQLLAFSRKQVLQPEIIDVTGVLAESSNLVRRLIGENIELNMNHGRDLRLVKVDQGQLEQVIINLAVNARDAMQGGGILTILTSNINIEDRYSLDKNFISPMEDEEIESGEYILIEVADTGTGIPKHLISKIFEPFFSTKDVGAGTGLGLSTVYGIVKQTGGYIYLTTEENKGTKFSIFLKSYESNEDVTPVSQDIDYSEKLSNSDLTGHGTILLVEDETPVRIFGAQALVNKGYKVLEAEDGESALYLIDQYGSEIDIIITDVIMPGMNGPTMIEEVVGKFPQIKVIFISGYAEDAFVKTYGTDNKFNFLAKPFTLKQLASKVKEVMMKDMVIKEAA
jgi:two-component system cell cycle sensor histidine kinase/response regulator CckA